MREISCETIANAVARLCVQACTELPQQVRSLLDHAAQNDQRN